MWSRSSRCISALVLLLGIAPLRIDASPIPARESRPLRVEILIDPEALPASDRERSRDRIEAIREALASGLPLLRSFDPREVLEEALGELAALGADVGENAIVNFDGLEVDVPRDARRLIAELPWVRSVGQPLYGTAAGVVDSEGLATIGADLAQAAGVTGAGVTVAIVDDGFNHLSAAAASAGDELPVIPTSRQYRVNAAGTSVVTPFQLDGTATQSFEGEQIGRAHV